MRMTRFSKLSKSTLWSVPSTSADQLAAPGGRCIAAGRASSSTCLYLNYNYDVASHLQVETAGVTVVSDKNDLRTNQRMDVGIALSVARPMPPLKPPARWQWLAGS